MTGSPSPAAWSCRCPSFSCRWPGDKFDDDGDLIDESTRVEIRDLLVALAAWTRRLSLEERLAS